MDIKPNKPLTEEERAAVEQAMADFGENSLEWTPSAPKKRKKPADSKPVLQISPLVRSLLMAAGLLVLLVGLLIAILGGGEEAPSPTTPEITPTSKLPTVVVVRPTDGTEESSEPATEVPVPPETQPTEMPTEAPTQPPTEPPTEAPTEPPVVLPEGTPVSSEEFAHLQDLFHVRSVYASMSRFSFTDPSTIGLKALLALDMRIDAYSELTEKELTYLAKISDAYLYMDICSISMPEASALLTQYYDLTIEDLYPITDVTYWSMTNRFYGIAEAYLQNLAVTHAVTLPNGNIWVRYIEKNHDDVGIMILSQAGEYHILSNTFAQSVN